MPSSQPRLGSPGHDFLLPGRPEPLAPFPSGCITSPLCRSFPVLPSLPNKTNPLRSRSALSPAGTPRAPPAPAAGSCQAAAPEKAVETGEGARARHGSSARAPSPGRSALHCGGRRPFLAASASAGWSTRAQERKKRPAEEAPPSGEKQGASSAVMTAGRWGTEQGRPGLGTRK